MNSWLRPATCNDSFRKGFIHLMTTPPESRKILSTSEGVNREAFSPLDWALFVSVALIWGSSFLLMDIGLESFEPGLITLLRVGLGAAALWLVPAARSTRIDRADWPRLVALSVIWVAVPFTLFPIAQQYINSAIAGMLNGAVPIFAAVVAIVMLGRLPRPVTIAGLIIGFAGVVAISAPSVGEGGTEALGVVLVVIATACYGLAMARMLALATLWTAPLGIVGSTGSTFAWAPFLAIVVAGVLGTGIAFGFMGNLVGRVGSTRASVLTYLIPVVALILGVVFRGDVVAPIAVAGVAMVIAGAVLASRRDTSGS